MRKRSEVEKLTGVSRRSLQEYDRIGLLHPSAKSEGGYWYYDDDAVRKLMLIQVFVEAGYERKEIMKLFDAGDDAITAEFDRVIDRLQQRRRRLTGMIRTVNAFRKLAEIPEEVLDELSNIDLAEMYSDKSFKNTLDDMVEGMSDGADEPVEEGKILDLGNAFAALTLLKRRQPGEEIVQRAVKTLFDRGAEHILSVVGQEKFSQLDAEDIESVVADVIRDSCDSLDENTADFVGAAVAQYRKADSGGNDI